VREVKLIVLDVDGTLTAGGITHHNNGGESKTFSSKDGLILKELYKLGISTLILTGRESEIVKERGQYLKITDVIQGVSDKVGILTRYLDNHDFLAAQTAYIGDDLNDFAAMNLCELKACPSDATAEVKAICDYVSPYPGGCGAVRDICEYLLHECGKYGEFLDLFGAR
jgi:3-deoxy-D-manno-octulosonate 8-phosphate phosphatase (KDO 8-P phosphatase)